MSFTEIRFNGVSDPSAEYVIVDSAEESAEYPMGQAPVRCYFCNLLILVVRDPALGLTSPLTQAEAIDGHIYSHGVCMRQSHPYTYRNQ